MERIEDLPSLCELLAAGKVLPVLDKTYPLSDAAEVLRYLAAG